MSARMQLGKSVSDQELQEAIERAKARYDALTPQEKVSADTLQMISFVTAEMFPDLRDGEVYTAHRLGWFKTLHRALVDRNEAVLDIYFGGNLRLLTVSDYQSLTDKVAQQVQDYRLGMDTESTESH